MSNISTLHIPVDNAVRKKFTARAKQLGFDSAQAYLRVMIKATVDGRRIDLNVDEWSEPSPEAVARLNKAAKDAKADKNLSGPFRTAEEFMKDLE